VEREVRFFGIKNVKGRSDEGGKLSVDDDRLHSVMCPVFLLLLFTSCGR
jgi:hypothetical protein